MVEHLPGAQGLGFHPQHRKSVQILKIKKKRKKFSISIPAHDCQKLLISRKF
jgi:hypothetical protein